MAIECDRAPQPSISLALGPVSLLRTVRVAREDVLTKG
jgi:hypothetical protein